MGNLIIAVALLLAGCGSKLPYIMGNDVRHSDKADTSALKGKLQLSDGTEVDLDTTHEPFILMFATYTCLSCKAEARKMLQYLATKPGMPKNVRIITVLVGSEIDFAERWRTKMGVTWDVGINPDDPIFLSRCVPERLTPCMFTQNLHSNPPVRKRVGEAESEELEKETGPWTY